MPPGVIIRGLVRCVLCLQAAILDDRPGDERGNGAGEDADGGQHLATLLQATCIAPTRSSKENMGEERVVFCPGIVPVNDGMFVRRSRNITRHGCSRPEAVVVARTVGIIRENGGAAGQD
jgi:hypothetical protein